MQQLRTLIYVCLAIAWGTFAIWQYRDYQQQRSLIEQSLNEQSQSIMTAMVGGMRSHRRLGRFFEEQLRGMLNELVKEGDVLYAAIRTPEGETVLAAGDASVIGNGAAAKATRQAVFQRERWFELNPPASSSASPSGGGRGMGRGGGLGGGLGGGRGRGSNARRWESNEPEELNLFSEGGSFVATLVLNRRRADELLQRVAWSHMLAVLAAGLVALSTGLVWRATMNVTEAKGRTRVVEAEARHLRELSQAAAGLAHETRNPLGLIRGWTQRLADSDIDEAQRSEHSRAVVEECDRVTARINQFLAFARPRDPAIEDVDIHLLLDEMAAIMQPDLEDHELRLHIGVTADFRPLRADPELLRQVIFNLLQNAVHFSPAHATIDVTVCMDHNNRAVLQVQDRGPGVQPETVPSLFTPYFTTRADGTGLGLAIVRHIATLHAWDITYRDREGGGAVFEISNIYVAT